MIFLETIIINTLKSIVTCLIGMVVWIVNSDLLNVKKKELGNEVRHICDYLDCQLHLLL